MFYLCVVMEKTRFKVPEAFITKNDANINFIALDDDNEYSCPSPDFMMDLKLFKGLTYDEAKQWTSQPAEKLFSIFQVHRKKQIEELDLIKEEAFNYLVKTMALDYPLAVLEKYLYYKVRISKMREILKPQSANVLVPHSKTEHKYWVAKAYDWDDQGNRKRTFNKSVIKEGLKVMVKLREIYEEMNFEVVSEKDIVLSDGNKYRADMVIRKNKEEYVVEVKMSRENLSRFMIAEALWESYKAKYSIT